MQSRASQFNPGNEVPEKNWSTGIFKRIWFNDYGAYTEHFRRDDWQDPRPQYAEPTDGEPAEKALDTSPTDEAFK